MFPVAQDDHDTIPIRVRYVAKDLWIRVNIARNISVQKARDIVLSHCQLTLAPPSAPPSTVDATVADSENTDAHLAPAVSGSPNGKIDRSSQGRSRGASLSTPHSHAKKSHASENGESGTLNHSSRTAKGASKGMMSDYNDRTLDEISIEDSEDDHGRQGSEVEVIELDREDQDDLFTDNDDELPSGTNARHAQSSRPVSPVQQSSAVPLPQSTSMDPIDARRDNPKQQRQRPLKKKRSLMSSGKAFLTKSLSNPSESAREMSDQPPQPQPASRSSSTPSSATTSLINQEPPNSNQKEKRKDSQQCDPDRDVFHKHSRPVDEDEAVTRAEELMARLDMFSESINAFGGVSSDFDYARSITKSNHLESGSHDTNQPQEAQIPPRSKPKRVQSHSSGILGGTDADNLPSTKNQTSNPSSTNYSLTSVANLTHGWAPWRDKNAGKVPTRERPDIGAWAEPNEAKSTRQNKENSNDPTDLQYDSGWRSAFGLFWVSAGHWLDESRQVSSYTIQPNELFELQLRNDYIQLPPPGSDLKYSDHYAEGILFKLSKKSRPVNILTAHGGRESLGVWKERWVVLQGNQLLISRKRKDQVKKTIVIPKPLTITTRGLPQVSRNLFKFTSPDSMSATMIALDISPDSSGKLCFRGSSENDINHWQRIFHSLNEPTITSMDRGFSSSGHLYTGGDETDSLGYRSPSSSAFRGVGSLPYKRQRHHTAQSAVSMASTMPSINPVLILNAAAALSNFNSGLTGTTAGHADITADHHVRNVSLSHTTKLSHHHAQNHHPYHHKPGSIPNPLAQPVYAANGYGHTGRPAMPLTSLAAKDDVRRRANTEPSKYKLLNGARGQLKILRGGQTAEASDVGNVSNISEAPFRLTSPPGRRRKPVLGTEYLDSASEALLARTSARSSMAPLYSGYIWLYIPNANDESFSSSNSNTSSRSPSPAAGDTEYKTNSTWTSRHQSTEELFESRDSTAHNDEDSIVASTGAASMSSSRPSPSTTPPPSNNVTNGSGSGTPRAANISMSKATGRYVKCFAAINEHGQLQWVEVKKQSELATSNKTATGVSSRASYGIPLRSDNNDSNSPLSFQRQKSSTESAESNKSSGGNSETSSSTSSSKDKQRMVQVCMAQKLRLFFFCIVISPASMSRLTMERTTTTSTNVVIQSPLRNIVEASELQTPNKPRQRLSATLSAAAPAAEADVAGSKTPNNALPPLPLQFMRSMPPGDGSVTTDSKAQPSIKKSASLPTGEAQTFDSHGAALSHEPSLQRAQSQTRIDTTARNQSALTASGEGNPSEAVTAEPQIGSQKSLKRCPPTRPRPETPPPLATKAAAAAANARAAEESKQGLSHPNSATSSQSPRLVLSSPVSLPTFSSSVFGSPVQGSSMSIAGVSMMPASPDSCRASSPDGALSNVTGSPVSPVMARAQSLQKAFRMMQQQQQQQEPTPAASPNSEKPNEVTVVSPSLEDSSGPSAHHVSPSETPMSASEDTTIHAKSTSENQCLMTTQGAPAKATRALASEESSHLTYESCPFLEFNPPGSMSSIEILGGDEKDGGYLTLRGYTETEEEWKALQVALERFVLGPTKDLKYALPPMDTLIPSYHSPPLPEVRLSEKAQSFLNAKPVPSSVTPALTTSDQVQHHHRQYYHPHSIGHHSHVHSPPVMMRRVESSHSSPSSPCMPSFEHGATLVAAGTSGSVNSLPPSSPPTVPVATSGLASGKHGGLNLARWMSLSNNSQSQAEPCEKSLSTGKTSKGTPGQQLNTRRLHSPSSTSLAVSGSTFAGAMEYPTGTHPPPTLPPPQAPAPAPAPTPPTSQNHYHSQTPLTVTATIYPLNDLTDLEANSQGQHFHLSPHVSSREQFSPPSVHEKDTFPSSERSTNHSNHQYYHNSHPMLQGNPASSRSRSRDHLSLSMGASSLHQGAKIRPRLNAQRSADELGKHSHIVRSPGPSSVGGSSPLFSVNGAESSLQAGAGFGFTMPHTSTTITHTTATPAAASPVKKREQRLSGTGLGLWIGSHAAEMIGLKSSKKHQQQLAQQLQPSAKDIVVKVDTAVMPSGQQQRLLNSDARSIPILASSVGTTADSQTKRTAPSLLKKSESSSSTTTVHTTSSRMTQDVGSSGSGDNITGVRAGMSPSYKDDHSSRDIPLGFSQVQGEAESATEPAYISQATAGREMTCASSPISVNTESVHVAMVSSLKAESGPSWYHHSHPQNTYDGQQQSSDQVYGSARSRTTTAEGGLMIQHPPTAKSDVHSTHLKKNGSAPPPRDPGDMYCPPPSQPHGRQVNNNDVGHRPNGASPLLKGHSSFSGAIQTVVASTGGDGTGEDTWIPDRERNGSSKRQNTVVGASKAAVSGVLGMFRKSVG